MPPNARGLSINASKGRGNDFYHMTYSMLLYAKIVDKIPKDMLE